MTKIMKTWNGYEIHDDAARNRVTKLEEEVISINDRLEELPSDSSVTFLEWDGDITDMECIEIEENGESMQFLYKYSNDVYSKDELLGCTIVLSTESEQEILELTEDMLAYFDDTNRLLVIGNGFVYIAYEDCTLTEDGVSISFTKGVWIINPMLLGFYIKSIAKQGELKTLDIKFIPDELYTKIDERIEAYIDEALGGEY